MAEEQVINTIEYNAADNVMAFPLDYSQKEIEDTQKLWDVDRHNINRISLRTLVTENPIFQEFFRCIRFGSKDCKKNDAKSKQADPSDGEKKYVNAIPVELLTFFKTFMQEAMSNLSFSKSIRKGKVPEDMGKAFYRRMLKYSLEEEKKENPEESELFWTRKLYDNIAFQDSITQDLWEKEYMLRVRELREMVRTLAPEQQLDMFYSVINHLDNDIVTASRYQKMNTEVSESQDKSFEHFLYEFPKSVISKCREPKVIGDTTKKVVFVIEDIPLSSSIKIAWNRKGKEKQYVVSTMQEVFRRICGNAKGSLIIKNGARNDYRRRLNQKTGKNQFQTRYEYSLSYLNACEEETNPETLRQQIATRAAEYFGAAFRGENALPGQFRLNHDGTFPQGEVNGMIESLVLSHYNYFCASLGDCLGFITDTLSETNIMFNWYKNHYRLYQQDEKYNENEDLYQRELAMYLDHLRRIMPEKLKDKFIVGQRIDEDQENALAELLVKLCEDAANKLGVETLNWANLAKMRDAIARYNVVLSATKGELNYPGFLKQDVYLRQALITCKVGEAIEFSCQDVETYIISLTTTMKAIKNKCLK